MRLHRKPSNQAILDRIHQLDAFKDEILNWIFEHREQGVCITVNAVVVHACSLSHEFAIKTWKVKARSVSRFLKKWGYVHRLGTHKSQTDPSLVQDAAREWMAMIVPTLVGPERDPNFILNMDQTPVKFENTSKGTLEKTGTKTITILATDADKRRCTAAITITASGIQLPNMVIFRGTATGRIARTELAPYPAGAGVDGCAMYGNMGEQSSGTLRRDSTCPHHTHHFPRFIPLPHDANSGNQNGGFGCRGSAHPRRMYLSLSAR